MRKLSLSSGILVSGLVGALGCGSSAKSDAVGAGGTAVVTGSGATPSTVTGSGGVSSPVGSGSGGIVGGGGMTGPGATTGVIGTGGVKTSSGGFPSFGNGGASTGTGGTTGAGNTPGSGGSTGMAGSTGTSGSTGVGGGTGVGMVPACLANITDYTKDGPFMVTTKAAASINFYVPQVPAGCKVPVVHLANGTGANCAVYLPSLQRLASNGFLAVCYETPNTGSGNEGLQAIDAALTMYPDIADHKIGSTGHSQGGQASFTVLALAEKKYGDSYVYAGLAMEPASGFGTQPTGTTWQALYGAIKSPMFMFAGLGTDGLVSQPWVQQAYDATAKTEEAYFWTYNGATHIPVPNAQEEAVSVPWFRWKLLGDQAACKAFKALPMTDKNWAEVAKKNDKPCQ